MNLPSHLREKLRGIPDEPGCYMFRDGLGRIIYVGKAISLRKRVQSYFRQATFRRGDPKLRGLVKSVHDLDYIVVRNEAEAVLTEGRLIKEYRPRYNVSFKDDKRFPLLRADAGQPFPCFNLCRINRADGGIYFGPYASSPAARVTLDFLEKKFGLRKCSPVIPDAETYKHCINDIVRYCSAPCAGKVSREEYRLKFEEACCFLRGERPGYLKELRESMEEASEKMEFERAAALRDTLRMLGMTVRRKVRIASSPEMRKEDGLTGVEELKKVLEIGVVPHVIEAFDISNIAGTYAVASMVCSENGIARRNRYRRFRIRTVDGSDDVAMMAEVISRRFGRLVREKGRLPDLVLVDGGIAQLNAARAQLDKVGLQALPAAGLAKKYEKLYRCGRHAPLRLPENSQALKVLQRLRDEAHRFALTYHRRLRSQRIKESLLDDISGIGEKKKKVLLERFGSVRRIKEATEDQIAAVRGIGCELAKGIKGRLSVEAQARHEEHE